MIRVAILSSIGTKEMTMNSTTASCTTAAVPLRRPLLERWWLDARDDVLEAWRAWRQHRRLQAELNVLRSLDSATLRDVGLDHLVPPNPSTLTLRDSYVGRW
jgi:hypothetical protein